MRIPRPHTMQGRRKCTRYRSRSGGCYPNGQISPTRDKPRTSTKQTRLPHATFLTTCIRLYHHLRLCKFAKSKASKLRASIQGESDDGSLFWGLEDCSLAPS